MLRCISFTFDITPLIVQNIPEVWFIFIVISIYKNGQDYWDILYSHRDGGDIVEAGHARRHDGHRCNVHHYN